MIKKTDIIDGVFMTTSGLYGGDNIDTLLGRIILILDIIWIISKGVTMIIKAIKNKKYNDVVKALKDTSDQLHNLQNGNKDGDD